MKAETLLNNLHILCVRIHAAGPQSSMVPHSYNKNPTIGLDFHHPGETSSSDPIIAQKPDCTIDLNHLQYIQAWSI